ncbi:amino acid adenylation domain-containing protein [Actinoplanes sp. NPDC026619]|uniref:non-ribosomal peptide synthetase n=1 Tax=Actinoplanes sp. NPDC026619 TaxID=3155798 RepID=UPI0033D0368A
MWMLQRLYPDLGISNEAVTFAVAGRLDVDRLARALTGIARRHPALRTVFPERDGEPVAITHPPEPVPIRVYDDPPDPPESLVAAFVAAPFDVTAAPPFRVGLWRYPAGDVCSIAVHHLVFDGTSAGVLFDALIAGYEADAPPGDTPVVPAPARPASAERDRAYWRAHLTDVATDRQPMALGPAAGSPAQFAGATCRRELPAETLAVVRTLAKRQQATDNIVLLAAFYALLARHGAGPDLVVGVPVRAGDPDGGATIGYHMNSLPVRVAVDVSASFGELVSATRGAFLAGLQHWRVSYEAVVPELQGTAENWRSPLLRYMFNYRPFAVSEDRRLDGRPVEILSIDPRHARQDLSFTIETGGGRTGILAVYRADVLAEADVTALLARYTVLLGELAAAGDRPVAELPCWSPRDRAVVEAANRTADPEPTSPPLDAVVAAGSRHPEAVAVVDGAERWTYRQLLSAAGGVRRRLAEAGVGRGATVAVYAGRSAELAAALLGIWAAGAAYLPLHPENPAELLSFQLADAGCALLLTDRPLPAGTTVPCPRLSLAVPVADPMLATAADPDDIAYVIYTSGSTGRPKGVEVTHANLANLIQHFRTAVAAGPADATLWLSNLAFDISALEVLLPMCTGGRVVVAPDAARSDGDLLLDLIEQHDVRIVQATPTTWAHLATAREGAGAGTVLTGRTVLCGGEALPPALASALLATGCRLLNVYGPTETTIWSTTAELTGGRADLVPVGVPLRNTTAFILDEAGAELPPGLTGELCLAGAGVARGYLNRPELTAQRYGVSPRHGRFYRTGDRAAWRHDGVLLLQGRTDHQVKIRAHRIELGEVEAILAEHPAVAAAAVVLRPDLPGEPGLVAFVQPATADPTGLGDALWRHARARLASYALPVRIEFTALPHTPSGKVDHRALVARPLGPRLATPGARPADGLARDVLEIWRELLQDPRLGPDDNFFLAGGQSLLAVRMLSRLSRLTAITLTLDELLDHPTATAFAAHIARFRVSEPIS